MPECNDCTRRVHADCVEELERREGATVCERRIDGRYFAMLVVQGEEKESSAGCETCCDAISDLLMRVRTSLAEQRGPEHTGGA